MDDFDNFGQGQLNFWSWKTGKRHEKVIEFEKRKRERTLNIAQNKLLNVYSVL